MEGMGEASHNAKNVFSGFADAYDEMGCGFERIVFRISTVGELRLIPIFKEFVETNRNRMPNVDFQFQISLHTSLESERSILIPLNSRIHPLSSVLSGFSDFAHFLKAEFRCNYMLLDYPNG